MEKKFLIVFCFAVLISLCGCLSKANTETAIRVSSAEVDAAEPAVASDADGNIYIVYVEHGADKTADVYLQKFNADGKTIGEKIRVNPNKGEAKAWFGDAPTIKLGNDKTIYIGWTAKAESTETPAANILYLSVSRDGGKTFDAPVKVNDDNAPASHGMHSLAIGKDKHVFMAWLDERNLKADHHAMTQGMNGMKHDAAEPNSEIFFSVSNDGGKTFSSNKKLSSEVCPCCKTSLLASSDGMVYASWRQVLEGDHRHIAVASSVDGGNNFSAPVIVSDDRWKISACPVTGAALANGENSSLKVLWFTSGEAGAQGLYWAESKDGGKTFSQRQIVNEGQIRGTPALLVDKENGFIKVWEKAANGQSSVTLSNTKDANAKELFEGELPTATISNGKLVIGFIKKENGKRSIWITTKVFQ